MQTIKLALIDKSVGWWRCTGINRKINLYKGGWVAAAHKFKDYSGINIII